MKAIRIVLLTAMILTALAGCAAENTTQKHPGTPSPAAQSALTDSDPEALQQQAETGDPKSEAPEDNPKTTADDPNAATNKPGTGDGGSVETKDDPDVFHGGSPNSDNHEGSLDSGKHDGGLMPSGEEVYHAYYDLLADFVSQYGVCETVFDGNGLFRGALIDFDGDGIEELICYYIEEVESIYSGYIVFGYNQELGKAELIEDHRNTAVEPYEVSIFKGQDGRVYVRNYCGQSYEFGGDFSSMRDNEWTTVLRWQEHWSEEWTSVEYTLNGISDISEAKAKNEFRKYQAELIYEFQLFDWDAPTHPSSNIEALLHELASGII